MSGSVEEIRHHVKVYKIVFASLAVLTVVTVLAAYLEVSLAMGITIALIIATIKGSLVACYFKHLISEKKLIYGFLVIAAIFLIVMFVLPIWADSDMVII